MSFADFSADGINPTDAGAKMYAEAVDMFIDDLMTAYPIPEKPTRYKLPNPLFPATNDNGRIVAYEDPQVRRSAAWKPGQESPIGPFRHVLVADEVGATVSLNFKGSEIGVIGRGRLRQRGLRIHHRWRKATETGRSEGRRRADDAVDFPCQRLGSNCRTRAGS